MSIIQRLNTYMEHTGLSSSQFADAAAIPRPSMSQILNGRNKKVSNELIEKLHVAFPKLNIVWLMFGEGPMETISNTQISEAQKNVFSPEYQPERTDEKRFSGASPQKTDLHEFSPSTKNEAESAATPVNNANQGAPGLFDSIPDRQPEVSAYPGTRGDNATGIAAEYEEPAPYGRSQHAVNQDAGARSCPMGDYGVSVLCSAPVTSSSAQTNKTSSPVAADRNDAPRNTADTTPPAVSDAITETGRSGERRIASIMVFYTDNSFQIFKPDGSPESRN